MVYVQNDIDTMLIQPTFIHAQHTLTYIHTIWCKYESRTTVTHNTQCLVYEIFNHPGQWLVLAWIQPLLPCKLTPHHSLHTDRLNSTSHIASFISLSWTQPIAHVCNVPPIPITGISYSILWGIVHTLNRSRERSQYRSVPYSLYPQPCQAPTPEHSTL